MAGGVGWLAIMTAIHRTPTFEWLIFLMGINGINGIHAGVLFHSLVVGGIWVFPKIWILPNHPFVHRVFHYKPSIFSYPYFWKHPYVWRFKTSQLFYENSGIIQEKLGQELEGQIDTLPNSECT